MELKRIKPYKAKTPEYTIKKIKTILTKHNLEFFEEQIQGSSLFKSFSLSIINPNNQQIVFQTFGKGSSIEWARASAWGEMIERIQNLAFYTILIYPSQVEVNNSKSDKFKYYPDEKIFSLKDNGKFTENYKKIYGIENFNTHNKNIIGIPFVNIYNNEIEYFPVRVMQVIVGSNGMCSGNTREEALIQGVSDIFERYVLKALYLKPFCPPDVPMRFFEGTAILEKINHLITQFGYDIRIKDCSMGKAYPVIGVLIKNGKGGYAFHLGADPSPITALERCLTEMFQSGNIRFQSIEELKLNSPYNLKNDFWRRNFSLTISAYAGQWPETILLDKPSYKFNGFEHIKSVSDTDDLQYLYGILKKDKRQVFIRDNSFLRQAAFYIYIPEMSEITNHPNNLFSSVFLNFDKYLPILSNLKESSKKERIDIIEIINKYIETSANNEFRIIDYFMFYKKHPIAQLSSKQFLNLLNLSIFNGSIEEHFSINEINLNPFLKSLYKENGNFILKDLFKKLNIPKCFECDSCSFNKLCNFPYIFSIWEKLKNEMKKNQKYA